MNDTAILDLITKGENAVVEFKRARGGVPADFWPSYCAFANTDGGTIVLGIREHDGKREIEGFSDTEKIVADIWNAANNPEKISANVLFNESVQPVEINGKRLVLVEVPRAERTARPVYVGPDVFKGTYRRNGEGDYHCSRETVEGMIRDKCAETADNCVIDEMTVADLDADTIRRYRMYFSQLRPGHVWSGLADEGFLMKIGAAVRGRDGIVHPNLAGLVCFGDFNEITNVLPYFFLDYREHLSPDVRWTDRVCSGDANWSGNIFSLVRIGERSGMGLSSLYGVWEKERFAEPSILETYEPDRTKVTVEFEADEPEVMGTGAEVGVKTAEVIGETAEVIGETAEMGVKTAEVIGGKSGNVRNDFEVLMGAYRSDFRDKARKVLSVFAETPDMDIAHVAEKLGMTEISVLRAIRALKDVGLLVRQGSNKGGKWVVTECAVKQED